jgi:biopolymer transport protein ExbD
MMAFGSFGEGQQQPMADINTTPLVDVMLVLLVIFIITAPLFNEAIPIDLPQTSASPLDEKPKVLDVALDVDGKLSVDGQPIGMDGFESRCREAVLQSRETELHLRADRATRYERVAEIVAAAQRAGMEKLAFVTDPATPQPSSKRNGSR